MKISEFIERYGDYEVTYELMELIETKEWKPSWGEEYWCIDSWGYINHNILDDTRADKFRLQKRNVYRTQEEAQFALDMYNFCKERSFKPDWNDKDQLKYYICLKHNAQEIDVSTFCSFNEFKPFYYPTKKVAQEVINEYSFEELEKYYGRV